MEMLSTAEEEGVQYDRNDINANVLSASLSTTFELQVALYDQWILFQGPTFEPGRWSTLLLHVNGECLAAYKVRTCMWTCVRMRVCMFGCARA